MGLSSTLNVHADVEGMELSELLNLLGSPKKLKESLSELEAASKRSSKLAKDLAKSVAEHSANVIRNNAVFEAQLAEADARVNKATAAEAKLAVAKNTKRTELEQAEASALAEKEELKVLQVDLHTREMAVSRKEENVNAEYARMEDINDAAQKEIKKDLKAAEKYRQDALKIRRESDDKVAAMKKLVA
tara:strand:- start:25 stop:591 length:567 start_codon:yes stop_codon:yes gene_type:complete